jgi:hypothetical protein
VAAAVWAPLLVAAPPSPIIFTGDSTCCSASNTCYSALHHLLLILTVFAVV